MKIAIEGCAHGDLDNIYETIQTLEEVNNIKIDLLICCGDFQSSRNEEDLRCMAVPPKYYKLCSFYKYYNGEKVAPVLTIFIGGNHEASNYLQELPYGGWVAPKMYYLGYAGVINVAGIRIAGISGIYKGRDFMKGHFEMAPYDENTKRSVYHIRNVEVFRLKQLSEQIDIFISHDWPTGIWKHGDVKQLLKFKPYFRGDIDSGELGSPPCETLLNHLKPKYWFAAHLHCKFAALVQHSDSDCTKFLALDKCLPKRRFLQVIDIPTNDKEVKLKYDLEWLTILSLTNHLMSIKNTMVYMPGPGTNERFTFTPTEEEKMEVYKNFDEDLTIPENFVQTVNGYNSDEPKKSYILQGSAIINPQTTSLCSLLNIDDPIEKLKQLSLNTSGLSSAEAHDFSINSTFVEDTDLSTNDIDVGESPILSKRISLRLPEPKSNSKEFEKFENEVKVEEPMEQNEYMSTPQSKKFKRRNGAMYVNESS